MNSQSISRFDDVGVPNRNRRTSIECPTSRNGFLRCNQQLIKIATWNVRTLKDIGKLHLITNELTRLSCDIIGLSEIRWSGKGYFKSLNNYTVYYSGSETGTNRGVAFFISPKMAKAALGYNTVNERLITIRFQCKPFNVTLTQVYTPTANADDDVIEEFYQVLEELISQTPTNDIPIIMDDFNAKVGERSLNTAVMGNHGLGEANDRGHKLVEFCDEQKLVIMNTLFKNHKRRRYTWISPGEDIRNQIDYILTSARWKTNVMNCCTYPSADCGTDHQPLMAKIKLRLKNTKREAPPLRFDMHNIPLTYTVETSNKFEALLQAEEPMTPGNLWESTKTIVLKSAKAHIPKRRKQQQSEWITKVTLEAVETRRKAKQQYGTNSSQYKVWNQNVQALCRKDKKAYIKSLSEKLEREANYGSTRSLFDAVRKLKQKFAPKIGSIKDENGYKLTDETSIKKRWKRYVEKLYESKHKLSDTYTDVRVKDDEKTEPLPLLEEVEKALNKIKRNKSPGQDEIPIELLTVAGNSTTILQRLCVLIWKIEK